jgi:ABC-type multidrug transport system ATPase subunit
MKLTISNVSKSFKKRIALQNISFELQPGIYGLLGPNGAGKTSLMKIIADIMVPTSGEVSLDGAPVKELGENYRNLLGYMPQNLGVYLDFTAEQYLLYIAALKGLPPKNIQEKVYEQLKKVGLEQSAKDKLKTFSGGMIRRIGIAQTLLNSPTILLLDEPTAGLDPQERIRLRNILSGLSDHCIVILSTHIVSDVELIAEKVILLNNGTLLAADWANNLLHNLKGMVWSFCISSKAELQELSDECLIGNVIQNDGDIQVRVVSRNKPHKNAVSLPPTMEDLYLFYFQGGDTH